MKIVVLSAAFERLRSLDEGARICCREMVLGFSPCGGGGGGIESLAIVLVEFLWKGFLDVTETDMVWVGVEGCVCVCVCVCGGDEGRWRWESRSGCESWDYKMARTTQYREQSR
jgi:hypothetical protein